MMLDASQRKFDNVLFWAMDRFSREGIEATLAYIRLLDSYKVGFRSYQEPFFDSAGPFKEFMISVQQQLFVLRYFTCTTVIRLSQNY